MANSEPTLLFHAEVISKALEVIETYSKASSTEDEYLRAEVPEAINEAKVSIRELTKSFRKNSAPSGPSHHLLKSA